MCKRIFYFYIIILLSFTLLFAYQNKYYQYLSPKPNAIHVSTYSTVVIRFKTIGPDKLSNLSTFINLKGSEHGIYSGQTKIASDQKTIIFNPSSAFASGEKIYVALKPKLHHSGEEDIVPMKYHFTVSKSAAYLYEDKYKRIKAESSSIINKFLKESSTAQAMIMANGVSVPSDFPHVSITINNNPDDGYIFLNHSIGQAYSMIVDNTGSPIWYLRTTGSSNDFKVQKNGILTMLTTDGFIGLDHNYTVIDTFYAGNGYNTDFHDLQVLEDGSYLIIGVKEDIVDMSYYIEGGDPNATVKESVIQHIDSSGNVLYEFRAWDNFNITDMDSIDLMGSYIYFPNMNAVDVDDDGHILISSRQINEITKINKEEDKVIWRLGGIHNAFMLSDDPFGGFINQHDIRSIGGGHYTLFDNGNSNKRPVSRAVEYELDTLAMTASLVWEFCDPEIFSPFMGNVQRLPNGNTLINWSDPFLPVLTEVTSNAIKAFEMNFIEKASCYRVFRFPWLGISLTPYLIAESNINNVTLIYNKFGDPNVNYYKIFWGTSPHPTTLQDTSKATLKTFTNFENLQEYYFRVTAVYNNGNESGFSNEENVFIHFLDPDSNLVANGDFSESIDFWEWNVMGIASADWIIENGIFQFNIVQGGENYWDIHLGQNGIRLMQGLKYHLEFDAWADQPRLIEVKLMRNQDPWTDYSKTGLTYITAENQHYSYIFEMEDQTDHNASAVFWAGTSNEDVYIDNISLKIINPSTHEQRNNHTLFEYKLQGNYPNPFNATTTIYFSLAEKSRVIINLYDVLGKFVQEICNSSYERGTHQLNFNGSSLSSGIYFCMMFVNGLNGMIKINDVHKIVVIK